MSQQAPLSQGEGFPLDERMHSHIKSRRRTGAIGRGFFIAATAIAVVALILLVVNIVNQTFGLVAEQNEVPPEAIVRDYQEKRVLGAPNVETSEDDQFLAESIGSDPDGVGFFGYAFYINNTDKLNVVSIEGVAPSEESANSGDYLLTRPLFIYTTSELLQSRPELAAFVSYYLQNVDSLVNSVGYFPADVETRTAAEGSLAEALQVESLPAVDPAAQDGEIAVIGSSTVFPVTSLAAEEFQRDGFAGEVSLDSVGTAAGFRAFCSDAIGEYDLVNASRPVLQQEFETCRANGQELIEIRIATDALVVAANTDNTFADNLSQAELQALFTEAGTWADVNSDWPQSEINRYIPSADSGTMDFFVDTVFDQSLEELPKEALVEVLAAGITTNVGRRLEREQRFFEDRLVFEDPVLWEEICAGAEPPAGCTAPERDQQNVYLLVLERIVQPTIQQSWYLWPSLTQREEIFLTVAQKYPNATVHFRSWLSTQFLTSPQSSVPELAGIRTAILGTLGIIVITIIVSFPVGVGAAIYLEEYADQKKWINRVIQTNINNLAGVPSIIYGMLGLAVFVRALEPITSGAAFGLVDSAASANGRTILSAGLTLALLILPIIIISAQEAVRAVPNSLRQASLGIGATKWQTIWNHVLPNAMPGILTGTIIATSRAIGETAPLVVIGASTFITTDPTSPFSKFTVLPIQIYQWTSRPQEVFRNLAGAAIIALLFMLLTLNATAIYLRNRFTRTMG